MKYIVIALMLSIAALPVSPVSAQQFAMSITPPLLEITIKPGKSVLIAYTVSNVGDPAIMSADVRPFKPTGILGSLIQSDTFEGPIRFNLDNSNIGLGKPFFLKSKEGQQLLLKIRVPEGTPEGDYYYTFYVQNETGRPLEGVTASLNQARIGGNILVTVTNSGTLETRGNIGTFTVFPTLKLGLKAALFESTDPVPVQLILQNTGRNFIKPEGIITLQGGFGEKANFTLVPQNILAKSSRLAVASTSGSLVRFKEPTTLVLSGFYVGKYTLTADVIFSGSQKPVQATLTFYALPFKLLLASGVALAIGLVIIAQFKRKDDDTSDLP
ncbi:hypothetical protein A3I56_01165 [Candidatus Roizmanbacteria bacterium RIFCSPLOWO2_02_FULL_43_10]|uniref:Uncharacterized protein n=2 Tax=Candidatus Roizmaniibacteriota TaxID=1752723 RepID=A0A1F7JYI3_9BACT|nr:MAG: hypothetical protein A3D08_00045 [Candidatus Roizmanbacteria bacterium RIFCSPHIGHO2_02_FULL_43_11]OGK60673.1 MAG: hypothetical protein A3I56_01165 [Candidatus Roizmanbacteria bacterium RIFCSPLOWO2_02_FULL_43_10]